MSGMTKAERLQEMKRLYVQRAYSDIELSERLEVDRTTVYRDRVELTTEYPVEQDAEGRYHIDRVRLISEIKVNLHEALALYLAARKSSRQTRFHQPHTASALEKLAAALRQPMTARLLKTAESLLKQEKDIERVKILETLNQAWVDQRKVRISYRGLDRQGFINHVISPYLIEPSIWSDSVYVIAFSDVIDKITPFKIERVESAILTGESFEIPAGFDDQEILKHAWGIWFGSKTPQMVRLRFNAAATRRVKESIWHPLETLVFLPDGGCEWNAEMVEWREMLPWVRGWGADVEVLEPADFRNKLQREAKRIARLYGVEMSENIPPYFYLWAKTDKQQDNETLHALVYHMLDVGECTLALWKFALSEQTRQSFSDWLGLDTEQAGRQLAFWASLHDLGKASPGFQFKYPVAVPKLKEIGFVFPNGSPNPASHGILSTWALKELLPLETGLPIEVAKQIAFALGGHHGAWTTNDRLQSPALQSSDKGSGAWDVARKELLIALKEIYQPSNVVSLPKEGEKQRELNTFLTLFSGLVSVADWIGSMVEYFPLEDDYLPPAKYTAKAKQQAKLALEKLGWIGWQADGNMLSFAAMFPQTPNPREIQAQTIQSASNLTLPALVILEAPTGIGKTEAALYLADTWLQASKGKGIYIAMPTQATSNQMFGRVVDFLQKRYPGQNINTHLVHGAALLEENEETPQPQSIADDDKVAEGNIQAETWFLPRKRTLLAPFGVGTVDQALMGILQTNHFFVRMFGLAQKIVIFDEVHAYDTYMSTLFQRLLVWLRSIGTSVILLSATLPDKTRQELVRAWLGEEEINLPETDYPRLTLASNASLEVISLPKPVSHTLKLAWVNPSADELSRHLAEKLKDGGCVAVICNRVQRAQEIYKALKTSGVVEEENLILFHARFPFQWRKASEERVLALFGKNGPRPKKSIVVATQVIEQSLDLDFDYMVTDLAPVDLLLQRAGRLHRHDQNNPNRPAGLNVPVLAISLPDSIDGLPEFGLDARIYDLATLLRTWHVIRNLNQISLPEQTSALIEAVYEDKQIDSELEPIFFQALQRADEKSRLTFSKEVDEALSRLIRLPDDEYLLTRTTKQLEEENEQVGATFRALTRLADPSITIICLHETAQGIAFEPDGDGAPLDVRRQPNLSLAKKLLRRAVSVQRRDVVNYFINQVYTTVEWRKSAAVRHHYPVIFDQNGECHLQGADFILKLTRELGLQVIKKEKA